MKGYFSGLTIAIFWITVLVVACNKTQYNYLEKTKSGEEIEATENKLEKVYNMYLGFFSNKAQAKNMESPLYRSQEIISVPIWPKRGDEYWLYMCWLQEDRPDDLLSQEVWNFKKKDRETIEVTMYDLPNKRNYVHDWRKKDPLGNLHPDELIYHKNCKAIIRRENQNKFTLEGEACERDLSDIIKYVEVHGILTPNSIVLYNKMRDANKEELFSYKEGLHFERQDKMAPKYLEED